MSKPSNNIVVAITGASGSIYAIRLLEILLSSGKSIHITMSSSAVEVFRTELGVSIDLENFDLSQVITPNTDSAEEAGTESDPRSHLLSGSSYGHALSSIFSESDLMQGNLVYHHYKDFSAGIASGSFSTAGMVICPCSMGTLAKIANDVSDNLIHRAASVHLKERRKLVLVPRETPLSTIQLENMLRLSSSGAVILPAMPGFYHVPRTIHDLVDFVVGRICDQLGVETDLFKRWGG